jgi:hypothetical protein
MRPPASPSCGEIAELLMVEMAGEMFGGRTELRKRQGPSLAWTETQISEDHSAPHPTGRDHERAVVCLNPCKAGLDSS